ncbi:MAG: ribonuclease E inhibitor RraB [Enterobacteriaceae bacterium]
MTGNGSRLQELKQETQDIIEQLLEDGSDPEALYTIEHHFSSTQFDLLEKLAIEAFRMGYEVTDAEEGDEYGDTFFSCDVIRESALRADVIEQQVEQLLTLATRLGVDYDGWGTYFEDGEEGDEEEEESPEEE